MITIDFRTGRANSYLTFSLDGARLKIFHFIVLAKYTPRVEDKTS